MINWLSLFTNAIWITGLAVGLAVSGQVFWISRVKKLKWALLISRSPWQEWMLSAGFLFSVGRLTSAQIWWLKTGWALVGLIILIVLISNLSIPGASGKPGHQQSS